MASRIQCVLCDIGRVLVTFDHDITFRRLANDCGAELAEVRGFVTREVHPRIERGRITGPEAHEMLVHRFGLRMEFEQFRLAWSDIFEEIPSTCRLIESLSQRYVTCIVSNTDEMHLSFMEQRFPVFRCFHHRATSFETGFSKPSPEIFEAAVRLCGTPPEACVFIDDIAEYAEAARSLGIHGLQFTTHERLMEELRRLGVTTSEGRYA